tara:strand:- start:3166 stop:3582 length:417 start_codon:yes stop_codon:yes gene_type:complete
MIWFVVFHPKEKQHWWAKRYGHVSLAGFSKETWTHLDLGRMGVDTRVFYAHDEVHDYLSYLTAHHVVLRFGPSLGPGKQFLTPMSCVSFVKHVLGVRSRALLPDQLFDILIRENKAVMMNETQGPSGNSRTESGAPAL